MCYVSFESSDVLTHHFNTAHDDTANNASLINEQSDKISLGKNEYSFTPKIETVKIIQ